MKTVFYIFIFLLPVSVFSQGRRDSLPAQHYITLRHDNDFLNLAGMGTDEYYSAGLYIEYSFADRSAGNILHSFLYSPRQRSSSSGTGDSTRSTPRYSIFPSFYTIGLTQWLYTPDDLRKEGTATGDYPYCGVFFLDLGRETMLADDKRIRSDLWLGMIGPAALADQTQNLVHTVVKGIIPEGWKHQIPNSPVINYNLSYEANLLSFSRILKVNEVAAVRAGTLIDDAGVGLDILISNRRDNFFPDRKYALNAKEMRQSRFYAQFSPMVRFVAMNSILQGGPFGPKDYYHIRQGDLNRVLFEGTGVMGMKLRGFKIEYRQILETAEFKTVHYHVYGCVAICFRV